MADNNNLSITLNTYEGGIQKYIDDTRSEVFGEFRDYIDAFLEGLDMHADILEIGSATGRDADYIEKLGYRVTRTDIVDGFLDYQRKQGKSIEKFDVINDNLYRQFDLIISLAVFHHFNREQFGKAIRNTIRHLKKGGCLALSVKQGEGEEYSEEKMEKPRYFLYWQIEELQSALKTYGFQILTIQEADKGKWLQVIACLPS